MKPGGGRLWNPKSYGSSCPNGSLPPRRRGQTAVQLHPPAHPDLPVRPLTAEPPDRRHSLRAGTARSPHPEESSGDPSPLRFRRVHHRRVCRASCGSGVARPRDDHRDGRRGAGRGRLQLPQPAGAALAWQRQRHELPAGAPRKPDLPGQSVRAARHALPVEPRLRPVAAVLSPAPRPVRLRLHADAPADHDPTVSPVRGHDRRWFLACSRRLGICRNRPTSGPRGS